MHTRKPDVTSDFTPPFLQSHFFYYYFIEMKAITCRERYYTVSFSMRIGAQVFTRVKKNYAVISLLNGLLVNIDIESV